MSGEQTSKDLRKLCAEIGTMLMFFEQGTPWSNKAELYIGLIKEAVRKDMQISNCPLAFWDFCVERHACINFLTLRDTVKLHGSNPHTALRGEEGDISNLCQFGFYDWCYYCEQGETFPYSKEILGRVLGPSKGEGNEMAEWILKVNGSVVPRQSPQPLTVAELHSPMELKKHEVFDKLIERRCGNAIIPSKSKSDDKEWSEYEDDEEEPRMVPETEDVMDATGKQLNQNRAYDRIINSEVALQIDSEMKKGKVARHAMGPDGKVMGTYNDNLILNTVYMKSNSRMDKSESTQPM